ncbi:hypothetical protein RJ640_000926 [Escallonia rubra]|uniref:Disease resistance protein winged helix domain-containing protein n=1 Tax=Escallonia rubra TaxID=112253 RepID=A0AA88QZ60_9ASTE|nr:hypothetical protein RJ640_000926 [Escallonia rubra]
MELVKKCGGLPLAILALAGAMYSKTLRSDWIYFSSSLNQELANNEGLEVVESVLFLSFRDLPCQLKHCFLYCCVFPEDYRIRRKRLIRLWIAEGFVEQVRGKTPERLADDYLLDLVHRSMFEVVMRSPTGRPKILKMHDIMRELAISMSEKENFCTVRDGRQATEGASRRLSIQTYGEDFKSLKGKSRFRSLFMFVADTVSPSSPRTNSSRFKLLRVLDLQAIDIEILPDEIVDLFNLTYFG